MTRSRTIKGKKKSAKTTCVVDGSVVMSWFFEDEQPYVKALEDALERITLVVPSFFFVEITNALIIAERRGRTTFEQASGFLRILNHFSIVVDEKNRPAAFAEILHLGRTSGLTAYDTMYLELALRQNLPLATLDKALLRAAKEKGVAIYKP